MPMNKVFDALSHPIRREVLELLKGGGMTAGEIADYFPVSKPTMSGHFAKLKDSLFGVKGVPVSDKTLRQKVADLMPALLALFE